MAICQGGQCSHVCDAGYSDCDQNIMNGCEVYVFGDPQNCGGCGLVCPQYPNTIPTCSNGQCQIVCSAGYADCDQNIMNGCETYVLGTDVNNCGGCNIVCPPPSGPCVMSVCQNGICVEIPLPAGSPCPGGNCDGAGNCIPF
jgi:hypothetical protein